MHSRYPALLKTRAMINNAVLVCRSQQSVACFRFSCVTITAEAPGLKPALKSLSNVFATYSRLITIFKPSVIVY